MSVPDEQRMGVGTYTCPNCEADLELSCGEHLLRDVTYCEDCRIKYIRERSPVAESVYSDNGLILKKSRKKQPEYERYYCEACQEEHENSIPTIFESQNPQLVGYDETTLTCPCGESHRDAYLEAGESITCDCDRVYTLTMKSP